jgi:hypothetical protein
MVVDVVEVVAVSATVACVALGVVAGALGGAWAWLTA